MPDILIRNVDAPVVSRLKQRAKRNQRSLQAELKIILDHASATEDVSFEEAVRFADEMRQRFAGRLQGDSVDLIRDDRQR